MLPGFARDREPADCVRARLQAALIGRADRDVLLLNLLADRDTLDVTGAAPRRSGHQRHRRPRRSLGLPALLLPPPGPGPPQEGRYTYSAEQKSEFTARRLNT